MFTATHPSFYYHKANDFSQAAYRLEQIAEHGAAWWKEEFEKLNLKPENGIQQIKDKNISHNLEIAGRDMKGCFNISLYLRAVSLELLLKGIYWERLNKKPPTDRDAHKVSRLLNDVKDFIDVSGFDTNELNTLLLKLDEILIWAGRYPEPKENNHAESGKKKLAETSQGYFTEDWRFAINMQLFKDFHGYVANHTSFNQ